jgi:hypothetical protein
MVAVDGYTFGTSVSGGWQPAQEWFGGGNVPYGTSGYYTGFWQFSQSSNNAIGRWLWLPADYDSTQNVTITFDFGPDTAGGSGNYGLQAATGCVTPGITTWAYGALAINATATTGAVAVMTTQYTHQQATTGTLSMTGCPPGSMAKLVVLRDTSVAGNSATALDLLDARLNYTRK